MVTATPFFQGSDALFLQGWKLQSSALITIHRAAKLPLASPTKLERLERPCQEWRVDILFCPSLVGHIFCLLHHLPSSIHLISPGWIA